MSKTPAQRARKHGERAAAAPAARSGKPANPTTARTPEQAQGNARLIIIAGLGASVFMFWYYHLLVLTQMTQLSGGLAMPDSLILGFSPEYAHQLQGALDDAARGQLNYVHKTAGTIFPLVTGFTFLLVFGTWLKSKALRWTAFALVGAFAVVRLWGNIAVDNAVGPGADAGTAALASVLVVLGWALLFLTLIGAGAAVLASRRGRRAGTR
ncbi:hypothetical protein GCM10012320_24330 [Sinomonas cellulolyticus]|uniref:Uncharacterized protein n=1 Tax=Sinomonas cellulolyticus TaxID=2801916 RepID=A0ABS1K004_9MICC|nr:MULTISPECIES: hypothetical protein [Sinomonas]MBL0704986.1 hypothetical protein [Sinomonas cellulolyticus]GHG53609.1 hypothetical protein GCM10012320_24330 [Sinomonas sp. KCTC 49339]